MRLFFAIGLPADAREKLASIRGDIGTVRWTPKDSLHLTLRFLGEIDDTVRERLSEVVQHQSWARPRIAIRKLGTFGTPPTILWAGIERDRTLHEIATALEKHAREAGLAPETRAYTPHVTLARLKAPEPEALDLFLRNHETLELPAFVPEWLELWTSVTAPDGARYEPFARYPLVGRRATTPAAGPGE